MLEDGEVVAAYGFLAWGYISTRKGRRQQQMAILLGERLLMAIPPQPPVSVVTRAPS